MKAAVLLDGNGAHDEPWSVASGAERELRDYCSREGAQALAEKIEAYWRSRGQDVMLSFQNVGFHPAIRAARFDLRSDMVNGLPRGATKLQAASPAASAPAAVDVEEYDVDDDDLSFE